MKISRHYLSYLGICCLAVFGSAIIFGHSRLATTTSAGKTRSEFFAGSTSKAISETRASHDASPESHPQLLKKYGNLPLSFEANEGQTDASVKFLSRGPGYTLFLTGGEAALTLKRPSASGAHTPALRDLKLEDRYSPLSRLALIRPPGRTTDDEPGVGDVRDRRFSPGDRRSRGTPGSLPESPQPVLRMRLMNANQNAVARGVEELPGKSNYFIGNDPNKWRTNVPTYAKVQYTDVYPGIDLLYYGNQRQLEHDFVVGPGADASAIALRLEGPENVSLDAEGNLSMAVEGGEVRFERPQIYQVDSGMRREIQGGYVLRAAREVAFKVRAYDRGKPLVIDPVLVYSTSLGGGGARSGGIAVDSSGNAYVIGTTDSIPTTAGAFQDALPGYENAFVTKLNPSGSAVVYSTYLGGSSYDGGTGIAVDFSGNAYVTGWAYSNDFPTTAGAFQTLLAGADDVFVAKLNPRGSALVYSTYLGGSSYDVGAGVAVDSSGNAYVTGNIQSPDFPTTTEAFQTSLTGLYSAFVSKLNPEGSALLYSTYLGGSGSDYGYGMALDPSRHAYVAGIAESNDFPTTPGAFQTSLAGSGNAFVTKLNANGSALVYSTYLGGSGLDIGIDVAVDPSGNAYAVGNAGSSDFPTTAGAFQTSPACCGYVFVTKLNPAGSRPVYSTLLGLSDYTNLLGIALDSSGHAYVTGDTFSADFPTTTGAFQTSKAPYQDAFVTELNSAGSALVYSTYLGGNGSDSGLGVAVDSMGDAYVTGFTCSYDFPTTPGVFRPAPNGTCERFVVKLALTPQAEVANLENTVKALVSAGTLNRGTGQLLLAPLNAALADLARGHATIAIRELNAFTFWVRLLVFFHRLTPAEGRTLIDAANSIIAAVR